MRRFFLALILFLVPLSADAVSLPYTDHFDNFNNWTFDGLPPDQPQLGIVTDTTSPDATSNVMRVTYPAGWPDGSAYITIDLDIGSHSELYIQHYFKFSSNFTHHEVEDKMFFVWGGNDNFYSARGLFANEIALDLQGPGGSEVIQTSGVNVQNNRWYKVTFHVKVNTGSNADGIVEIWVDDVLKVSRSNARFWNGGANFNQFSWAPVWGGYGGPNVPQTMYLYLDGLQIQTTPIGGGGPPPTGDIIAPTVSGRSPSSGDTNVATTSRNIVAHFTDAGDGVDITKIKMSVGKNGGAKTAYTCASGLTCTGSSTDYTATRTMASDWTAGDVVQVLLDAADLASPPNVMGQVPYSFSVISTSGGPYPQSNLISGVNWDFTGRIQTASGSDQWPMTWAGDNNVYTLWDDGGGFGGSDTVCRTQYGMAKITNNPPSTLSTTNVYGCKSDGTGCDTGATHDAGCNASYASAIAAYGEDIVAIDNVLYSIATYVQGGTRTARITHSTDFGHTWTANSWAWSQGTGDWRPDGFLQLGMGYTGGLSQMDYMYIVGAKVGDTTHTYLARYPLAIVRGSADMTTQSGWQWFAGNTSSPSWGAWGGAVPIHTDAGGGSGGHMTYFAPLGRYVFSQSHGGTPGLGEVQKLGMYDSPNPWGPWTTIMYSNNWGSYGTSDALWYSIPGKWISSDGKTFWLSFSGATNGTVAMDSLNLIKGTFTTGSVSPPTGATGSYFYGPYFYGSMY